MQIIDSHQHFWKYDPVKHDWITDDMSVLKRDYLPADLLQVYQKHSVNGCVAVQADQSEDETQFLIRLANEYDFILGVVGWVDLRAEDIYEQLEKYTSHKKLKGFRHVLQSEADRALMLGQDFQRGIRALGECGFTYDILIFADQLNHSTTLAGLYPERRFVLDHIAKPAIKLAEIFDWKKGIEKLALHPNVFCKISGMVTEANLTEWTYNDFVPYLDVIVENFGMDRIMFGSDWPVCLLAGSYGEILNIVQTYFAAFNKEEQQKIFADNAINFYKL